MSFAQFLIYVLIWAVGLAVLLASLASSATQAPRPDDPRA